MSVYEPIAVSGTTINATAFIIYACVNLPPARAKYTEYKSPICAMGVFRSHTPRACECSPLLPLHPNPTFSLTIIYRSVARSRPIHRRKIFTIGSSGAFPPFPDTPALPFLFLPRLEQFYILCINPALP